jgi:hypothetical protein
MFFNNFGLPKGGTHAHRYVITPRTGPKTGLSGMLLATGVGVKGENKLSARNQEFRHS